MVTSYRSGGIEGRPKATDGWRTPPGLYRLLDEEFSFAVDVACESWNCLAPNGLCVDQGRDGSLANWRGFGGAVWCNPPYSSLRPWLEQGIRFRADLVSVFLVPADTSTRWWYECVNSKAREVRFVVGRVKFLAPDGFEHRTKRKGGGMTTPSAIVVYGPGDEPTLYSYLVQPKRKRADGQEVLPPAGESE